MLCDSNDSMEKYYLLSESLFYKERYWDSGFAFRLKISGFYAYNF